MINGGKISALGWSLAVHAVIAAGFIVTVRYTVPVHPQQPAGQVIEAVAIDAEALRAREREKVEAARRAEEARQAELRRQREAAAAEQRRREEQARQAELKRQEDIRRKQEAEAEAERQRQAEARRKAEAEAEARRKAEAERQRREAEARAARESELQRSLEAEADRLAAIESGKQAEWIGAIRNKMERILVPPPGTRDDFYCEAELRQIPGGEVVQVKIGKCDSDLLARAVETAAWKASPLPRPSDPSLFESYVTVIFAPEEK